MLDPLLAFVSLYISFQSWSLHANNIFILFLEDPTQIFDLTYSALDGDIELIPRVVQMQMPTPPPNQKQVQKK